MKKVLLISAAAISVATSVHAAQLIAGWDTTNLEFSTIQAGSLAANWSDVTGDGAAKSNGAIYWDGAFGSSAIPAGLNSDANYGSKSIDKNRSISSRIFSNQMSLNPQSSLGFSSPSINGSYIVIGADAAGADLAYNNIVLTFASAITNGGSVDVTWEYSTDGGATYLTTGVVTTIDLPLDSGNGGEVGTVDLADDLLFAGDVLLRGQFSGVDSGEQILFDNVQITGNVVPEPSTYAIIAGVAVLGLAIIRRRRKA